jgi:exodeoxyribonuclease VII large subunit
MQPLTVSNLLFLLKDVIEGSELFADLWVRGEVSNYTQSRLGHRYFSLKDESSTLRSVLFRDDMPGESLEDGDRVLAHGRVSIYTQRGELQFVTDFVQPEGVGLLAAQSEQLRQRLEAEGLFSPERKRPLPAYPRVIGIVTSPTGAALRDVVNVLERRWPLAELILAPALVQGDSAPAQIVGALQELASHEGLDVAILARGGGGAEDLQAFNDERVARAIFGFPFPLISGVGHETDITIADLVADVRAPTPSAAAEHATPDQSEVRARIASTISGVRRQAFDSIRLSADAALRHVHTMERSAPDIIRNRESVASFAATMGTVTEATLRAGRSSFAVSSARVDALNPSATLARGFAAVAHAKNGKPVTRVRDVSSGDRLSVAVSDGAFWTEVS